MYNISYKYKEHILTLFKFLIVLGAFYFIYNKLATNQQLPIEQFQLQLSKLFSQNRWLLLIVLLLTDTNWILEIFKWKILVSKEKKINFLNAFEQCLGSLSVSLITPNRIGEYGAKALYFKKTIRKKIMLLNLIGNLTQLFFTIIFGIVGLVFLFTKLNIPLPKFNAINFIISLVLLSISYAYRRQLKLSKIRTYIKQISQEIYLKVLILSFLRFVVFSHQFYLLTTLFGIEISYPIVISLIFSMYLLASIIPSIAIFDWLIKGSIAVFLFSFINIDGITIVTITTIMWILNFAIPSILGSVFVLNFKLIDHK